jgi:4-hydroxy-tetrahydrodipicolinate reductase
VVLAGQKEMLSLRHDAFERSVFAEGALTAAAWAFGRPPGLYGLKDVLGL